MYARRLYGRGAGLCAQQFGEAAERAQTRQRVQCTGLGEQLRKRNGTCQGGGGSWGRTGTGSTGTRRILGLKVSFLQLNTREQNTRNTRIQSDELCDTVLGGKDLAFGIGGRRAARGVV